MSAFFPVKPVTYKIKPFNSKIIFNRRLNKQRDRRMTLIIAARCKDGVVLVGDRKVTNSVRPYTDKIRKAGQLEAIIFTAAGDGNLFEEFLTEIERATLWKANWIEEENKKVSESLQRVFTSVDFKRTCVETLTTMKNVYSERGLNEYSLQVLFVVPEIKGDRSVATLYKMDTGDCFPNPMEEGEVEAIGYPHLGRIFLKNLEEKSNYLTMRDVARVAALTIKYIDKAELAEAVGVGTIEPQIWFVEDGKLPREIKELELQQLLSGIDEQITKIFDQIKNFS